MTGFIAKKPLVFDNPRIVTQSFKVSIKGKGEIIVKRKEVFRKTHHMGCTDHIPDEEMNTYEESMVEYECYQKVDMQTEQEATTLVEEEIEKMEKQKWLLENVDKHNAYIINKEDVEIVKIVKLNQTSSTLHANHA